MPRRTAEDALRSVLAPPVPYAERYAAGRAARETVGWQTLGAWDPTRRARDALQVVGLQNASRVRSLVPLRMERMSASPWNYYRGAAGVMAADLALEPHTAIEVQLCGDAHVLNYGLWATPERQLSFDLRDFDETLRGPFEWDVKRFAASLVVLARENGVSDRKARRAIRAGLRAYRDGIEHFAQARELTIWYELITAEKLLSVFEREDRGRAAAWVRKRAKRRTSHGAARKLTRVVDGRLRIVEDPPFRMRLDQVDQDEHRELAAHVMQAYHDSLPYERRYLLDRFTLVDVVQQVVGVGSVGLLVFLVLFQGRGDEDPLFLQVKQAVPSVYEEYLGASGYPSHGERVVSGKRLIQAASDIFLGWTQMDGLDFYVRQFRDMKVIPDSQSIAPYLVEFATRCGAVMARAHARTGDAAAIAGYIGKGTRFDEAIREFGYAYADQTFADHAQLAESIRDQ